MVQRLLNRSRNVGGRTEQTSPSEQEIKQTSPEQDVKHGLAFCCFVFKHYLVIHLNKPKTFTHTYISGIKYNKYFVSIPFLGYPKEQANQAGKHNWFEETELSKYLPDTNKHKFEYPQTV